MFWFFKLTLLLFSSRNFILRCCITFCVLLFILVMFFEQYEELCQAFVKIIILLSNISEKKRYIQDIWEEIKNVRRLKIRNNKKWNKIYRIAPIIANLGCEEQFLIFLFLARNALKKIRFIQEFLEFASFCWLFPGIS